MKNNRSLGSKTGIDLVPVKAHPRTGPNFTAPVQQASLATKVDFSALVVVVGAVVVVVVVVELGTQSCSFSIASVGHSHFDPASGYVVKESRVIHHERVVYLKNAFMYKTAVKVVSVE